MKNWYGDYLRIKGCRREKIELEAERAILLLKPSMKIMKPGSEIEYVITLKPKENGTYDMTVAWKGFGELKKIPVKSEANAMCEMFQGSAGEGRGGMGDHHAGESRAVVEGKAAGETAAGQGGRAGGV